MVEGHGYAAKSKRAKLKYFEFKRRDLRPHDVLIDIEYCGVCHSDVHQARNEWGKTKYPIVPGHEIVGRVRRVGKKVSKFKAGDLVGVGCFVDSCGDCESCKKGLEQYCEYEVTETYNSEDRKSGEKLYGGYSDNIVVRDDFVLRIPKSLSAEVAGPILCAGITTYSPLKHWKVGKGSKVGVLGLGGLGHMAVQLATALGAEVTVITTHKDKLKEAIRLGAVDAVTASNKSNMKSHEGKFDFILDTIPEKHDVNLYTPLLKVDGVMCIVGLLGPLDPPVENDKLIMKRQSVTGSLVGGIEETQEVLDFCAKHKIQPEIELIPIQKINEAFDRMVEADVHYRFVIDMNSLREEAQH